MVLHSISNVQAKTSQQTFPFFMLPAVRGAGCCSSPRVSLRVHQLKLSSRSLRGHSIAEHIVSPHSSFRGTTHQQRRVLATRTFRCDAPSTSNSTVVPLTLHSSRPSVALVSTPPLFPVAMSATKVQTRSHAGHSHHGHHHHHDTTYLTSTSKHDAGVRITRIGLYVNLGMAISKGIGGYVFHSQGISSCRLAPTRCVVYSDATTHLY